VGAAVLDEEVGLAFDGERANLVDVGGVVQGTGGDGLVELKRLIDELERGDQHVFKGSRLGEEVNWVGYSQASQSVVVCVPPGRLMISIFWKVRDIS
jgi:hypothetical protein